MKDSGLISADSHVIEPADLFEKGLPARLRSRAPRLDDWKGGQAWVVDGVEPVPLPVSAATGSGYRALPGERGAIYFEEVLPSLYDPGQRLRAQDADSVDAEVIYPSPGLWDAVQHLDDLELRLGCVRAYNDWIAEFSSHSPDRLIGLGRIPSTGRDDAIEEVRRCVEHLHLRGVLLDAWPGGGAEVGDPGDDAFWATIDEFAVPVSIHYGFGLGSQTAPPSGIAPGLNPPMADLALPLVATGLFDRRPNVRIVFAHGNAGWVVHWLEFLDISYVRNIANRKYHLEKPDSLPSEYIRRHFWFTFHQDRAAVKNRQKIGTSHLLWASHFPLDAANWPDDRQQAMRATDEINGDDRQALLADNTARLYRLPGFEAGFSSSAIESLDTLMHR